MTPENLEAKRDDILRHIIYAIKGYLKEKKGLELPARYYLTRTQRLSTGTRICTILQMDLKNIESLLTLLEKLKDPLCSSLLEQVALQLQFF